MAPRNSDDQTTLSAPGAVPGQPAHRDADRRRGGRIQVLPRARQAIRTEILQWAHQWPQVGWLVPVFGAAACAALARYLVINAAGAGAGLAVASMRRSGASVFVVEELTRSVTPRLLVATLVTSAIAVAEMRALLGNAPDFLVARGAVTPIASLRGCSACRPLYRRQWLVWLSGCLPGSHPPLSVAVTPWLPEPAGAVGRCIQRHHRRLSGSLPMGERSAAVGGNGWSGCRAGCLFAPSFVGAVTGWGRATRPAGPA